MLSKLWRWIEVVLMILGFIYTLIVIVAFILLMAPILLLFERTTKPHRIGESDGTKNQASQK